MSESLVEKWERDRDEIMRNQRERGFNFPRSARIDQLTECTNALAARDAKIRKHLVALLKRWALPGEFVRQISLEDLEAILALLTASRRRARIAERSRPMSGKRNRGRIYPCIYPGCKVMRTKEEGGTTFTVCDKHWGKKFPKGA